MLNPHKCRTSGKWESSVCDLCTPSLWSATFGVLRCLLWRLNPGFGIQKTCPFPLNRDVPSIEVMDTKIMLAFFWDQILCPLKRGVPKERFHCIEKCVIAKSSHKSDVPLPISLETDEVIIFFSKFMYYSQLSLRRTPLGPALSVRLQ